MAASINAAVSAIRSASVLRFGVAQVGEQATYTPPTPMTTPTEPSIGPIALRLTLVAALISLVACGGRTPLGEEAPVAGRPDAGGPIDAGPGPIDEPVPEPFVIFPPELGEIAGSKVVARAGGFDVLASRDGDPAVLVRRYRVRSSAPYAEPAAAASELMPGVVSGLIAAASDDVLSI